ncbi:MAG: hypothetical protein HPY69_17890 [Armatimonadetes bacterium]|nr:hypothetical protein [Armatimonadota bacterium]
MARSLPVCLLLFVAGPLLAQETACKWVWYPESPASEAVDAYRYFRRTFDLAGPVRKADLWFLVDDGGEAWVNGQSLRDPAQQIEITRRFDVTALLRPGRNVVAARVRNAVGVAGLIAKLMVRLEDGNELAVVTDGSWRASREGPEGWTEVGFDDGPWPPVRIMGSAFRQPWYGIAAFHMPPFITVEEAAARARAEAASLAPPEQFSAEPPARVQLRSYRGAPALFINGRPRPPVWYRGTVDLADEFGRRQITNFRDAGVHLYTYYARMDKTWLGPGQYDFSQWDTAVRQMLALDPEGYILLQPSLVPPDWWLDAHPEELVRYATSEALDSSDESFRVRRPSLASEVWLRDASEMYRALVTHMEQQPWGKRVIGWHACYGIYGEWHYYGSWSQQYPDTGQAMTAHFRRFLRSRYGTEARLQEAWNDPQITFATAAVPGLEERRQGSCLAFRDPATEQRIIDYYQCHQAVVADDILHFARLTKELTRNRTIFGVYYGYFFGVPPQTQGGHLELLRLLRSPDVDYCVAPYDYANRLMGDDGRLRSLAAVFNACGKTHIIESDTRTYLHNAEEYGRTANVTQSLAAIRREFTTALTEHTGFWYVDFGPESEGGWFDDPQLMAEIARQQELARSALTAPRQSVAEVALVCDLQSAYYLSDGEGMSTAYSLISNVGTEMYRLGAPFDALCLPQLATVDLSRYKLLVFLNCTAMTDQQAAMVERLRRSGRHAMVFLWAPGLDGPQGLSVARSERVTGLPLELVRQHLPAEVVVSDLDDPLVHGLPRRAVSHLKVTSDQPVPGFDDASAYDSHRDEKTMREEYVTWEVTPIAGGVCWTFETSSPWTDIHWDRPVAAPQGVSLEMKVEGHYQQLSAQVAIKDANWAEFATREMALTTGDWRQLTLPFANLANAPWAQVRPPRPARPLQGMKFVFRGTQGAGPIRVHLRNLRALDGELATQKVSAFGAGSFGPALVPASDSGEVLGVVADTSWPGLVRTGSGRGLVLYCAIPFLPREVLRNAAREAGVHVYSTDAGDVVRGDSRYFVIHTREGGTRRLRLPRAVVLRDAMTGETVGQGRRISVTLPPDSTTVWEWASR